MAINNEMNEHTFYAYSATPSYSHIKASFGDTCKIWVEDTQIHFENRLEGMDDDISIWVCEKRDLCMAIIDMARVFSHISEIIAVHKASRGCNDLDIIAIKDPSRSSFMWLTRMAEESFRSFDSAGKEHLSATSGTSIYIGQEAKDIIKEAQEINQYDEDDNILFNAGVSWL